MEGIKINSFQSAKFSSDGSISPRHLSVSISYHLPGIIEFPLVLIRIVSKIRSLQQTLTVQVEANDVERRLIAWQDWKNPGFEHTPMPLFPY